MFKQLAGGVVFLAVCCAVFGALYYTAGYSWNKPDRYQEGVCLKMAFPGVENWHNQMTARVVTIGQSSYAMEYWLEYGWSAYKDTWPFSLNVVKVPCPQEVKDESHP